MNTDSPQTNKRILQAAKEEFLSKGYTKTSLRAIAKRVGISATAIYRHFKDKETLFAALVEPDLYGMLTPHSNNEKNMLELVTGKSPSKLWEISNLEFMKWLRYVYDHFDSFKLLICCSDGTRLQDFQHRLVEDQVDVLLMMWEAAKENGHSVNPVSKDELHLIMSGFISSLFEMVIHDYSEEKMLKCGETLAVYFNAGIRAVLGF